MCYTIFATLIVLLLATGIPAAPYGERSTQPKTATGCSCNGVSVKINNKWKVLVPDSSVNGLGVCFYDNLLANMDLQPMVGAIVTKVSNTFLNADIAWEFCNANGNTDLTACLGLIYATVQRDALGPKLNSAAKLTHGCNYPTDHSSFEFTDCQCGYACFQGYVACGNECIDPTQSTCIPGAPPPTAG